MPGETVRPVSASSVVQKVYQHAFHLKCVYENRQVRRKVDYNVDGIAAFVESHRSFHQLLHVVRNA